MAILVVINAFGGLLFVNDAINWLFSVGLVGLVLTISYREWGAWRARKREREGLLYLVDMELGTHTTPLEFYSDAVSTLVDKHAVVAYPDEKLARIAWDATRVRLAQLIDDKSDFLSIALYYYNLTLVRRLEEDRMQQPIVQDADIESWQASYAASVRSLIDHNREARRAIRKYISQPYEAYEIVTE